MRIIPKASTKKNTFYKGFGVHSLSSTWITKVIEERRQ